MDIDVSPDWWKTLFDETYLRTDARSVCDEATTRREVDVLCDLLTLETDDRILDLCGGQGRHSLELCRRGYRECTVLDYSFFLVERGRSAALEQDCRLSFVQGDAGRTGLQDGSFDCILVLGNSLGYLPGREDDERIVREAYRLLRPGGSILIDVTDGAEIRKRFSPNAWHEIDDDIVVCRQRALKGDRICAREVVLSKDRGLIRDRTYAVRLYLPEELAEMVAAAGFRETRVHRGIPLREGRGDCGFMEHRVLITAGKGSHRSPS